jgi:hypothetical protein
MWTKEQFCDFIILNHGGVEKYNKIIKSIETTVIDTIKSFQGIIKHRDKSFEWLGFDFLIDDCFNVWLLEVNVSPDNSHSTDILDSIVPTAVNGVFEVILDEKESKEWRNIYSEKENYLNPEKESLLKQRSDLFESDDALVNSESNKIKGQQIIELLMEF